MSRAKAGEISRVSLGVHGARTNTKSARRLKVETADGVKEVSHEDVLTGLVKKTAIETAVEGKRPRVIQCADCGKPKRVGATGVVPTRCDRCAYRRSALDWLNKNRDKARATNRERMRRLQQQAPDGLRKARLDWYRRNIESERGKSRERQRTYRANNPEQRRQRYAADIERSRAEVRAQQRRRREDDDTHAHDNAVRNARRAANPNKYREKGREAGRRYRAKKKAEREAAAAKKPKRGK